MRWRRFVGSAFLVVALAPGGCAAGGSAVRGVASQPGLAEAVARAGGGGPGVARSQKPDGPPADAKPLPPLDLPPERPTELGEGRPVATIRALVNDQAILDEEVRASCYQELRRVDFDEALPPAEKARRKAEVFNAALTQLIEREVVLQDLHAMFAKMKAAGKGPGGQFLDKLKEAAAKEFDKQVLRNMKAASGIKSDDEFKRVLDEQMRQQGLSLAGVRRQWERNFMSVEYLRQLVWPRLEAVGHVEMLEYYQRHPEEFQVSDAVQWQDVFVSAGRYPSRDEARRAAEGLADRLRKGEDVAKLLEHDDGDSSLRNGDGVGRKRGEIKPAEAEPVLFGLKDGEAAVVEIATGFHVVRLVKRDHAGTQPFDEKAQRQIRDKLRNEKAQVEIKRIINGLKLKAVIVYAHKAN